MAVVCRFEDSGGVTRLNLADPTGFEIARGLNFGTNDLSYTWLTQSGVDGATLAASDRPITMMTIPVVLHPQPSMAALEALWDDLMTELNRTTNILRFQADGAATATLFDTYRSQQPSKYRGLDTPFVGSSMLFDPEPIPLVIPRSPIPRSGPLV